MEIKDLSGTPRSDEELDEALDAITKTAVNPPMDKPFLAVNLMNIRDLLRELKLRRKRNKRGRSQRNGSNTKEGLPCGCYGQ